MTITCILGSFLKNISKIYWNEMNLVSFSFGSMLVVRHRMVIILLFWDVSSEINKNIVSVQNDVGLKRSISVIKRFSMTWLTSCVFVCFCCFHDAINFIYFSKSGGIGPLGHLFYYFGSNCPWLPCVYIDNFVKTLLIVIALC